MAKIGSDDSSAFEQRVYNAMASFECDYEEAMRTGAQPPKLSISSFTKKFGITRSILYERFPLLVNEIKAYFDKLRIKRNESIRSEKKKSVTLLHKEILELRRLSKQQIASAASISFTKMLEQCGPAFRERTQLMLERQDHLRIIEDLQRQVRNQARLIQTLMAQLNAGDDG